MAHHESSLDSLEWRVVPGFEAYEVSEYGHLRRIRPHRSRPVVGYVLKPKHHQGGYLHYDVSMHGKYRRLYAHRAVALAFHGMPLFPDAQAAHKDGNKKDNHYTNLYWATHQENAQDNVRHGISHAGEMSPVAKLSWAIAAEIRRRYFEEDIPYRKIAKQYDVSEECVRAVIQGQSWNTGDIQRQCLIRKGERNPRAKLSQEDVANIRKAYFEEKITQTALALQYGVKRITIFNVLHNTNWQDSDYHMQSRGFGERHMSAKLTEQDVKEIRELHTQERLSQRALARRYGVTKNAIAGILHGITWTHVE